MARVAGDGKDVRQSQDGVGDELARPVERDRPSPVHIHEVGSEPGEPFGAAAEVGRLAAAAHRVHGRVLEHEHHVVSKFAGLARRHKPLLERPGVAVRDGAEPPPPQRWSRGWRRRHAAQTASAATACSCAW